MGVPRLWGPGRGVQGSGRTATQRGHVDPPPAQSSPTQSPGRVLPGAPDPLLQGRPLQPHHPNALERRLFPALRPVAHSAPMELCVGGPRKGSMTTRPLIDWKSAVVRSRCRRALVHRCIRWGRPGRSPHPALSDMDTTPTTKGCPSPPAPARGTRPARAALGWATFPRRPHRPWLISLPASSPRPRPQPAPASSINTACAQPQPPAAWLVRGPHCLPAPSPTRPP